MDIPLIEQVKIQAQVLVPLVRVLQVELGEERANAIVRKALGDLRASTIRRPRETFSAIRRPRSTSGSSGIPRSILQQEPAGIC